MTLVALQNCFSVCPVCPNPPVPITIQSIEESLDLAVQVGSTRPTLTQPGPRLCIGHVGVSLLKQFAEFLGKWPPKKNSDTHWLYVNIPQQSYY